MQLEIPASGSATDCRPRPQGVPRTAFERKSEKTIPSMTVVTVKKSMKVDAADVDATTLEG